MITIYCVNRHWYFGRVGGSMAYHMPKSWIAREQIFVEGQ